MYTKKAFSIVETLIALTIFSIIAAASSVVMSNVLRSSRKINSQIFLYTETQALMDQLTKAVQRNTVDYEAYYARNVLGESGWNTENYGFYGQAFYNPGVDGGPDEAGPYDEIAYEVDGYGTYCEDMSGSYPTDCSTDTPVSDSQDYDTGANPFDGIDSTHAALSDSSYMNAFCSTGTSDCQNMGEAYSEELILINSDGSERLIFVRENSGDENYQLSQAVMYGSDSDYDGISDEWTCASDYSCTATGPDPDDLTDGADSSSFMPISPSKLQIEEFYVYISPVEDPYRAFAEADTGIQIQPQVTIIITTSLSSDYGSVIGTAPTITIQRTISAGVYSEVTSYE
jgi:prepilin-type N-terminal cleavage/methylation domain-containing protein